MSQALQASQRFDRLTALSPSMYSVPRVTSRGEVEGQSASISVKNGSCQTESPMHGDGVFPHNRA